jgi:hypothetical protein
MYKWCVKKKIVPHVINYNVIKDKIGNYQRLDENELNYIKQLSEKEKYVLIKMYNMCLFNLTDALNYN